MNSDLPKRIPVPFSQRWKDVRFRLLPVLVFGGTVLAIVVLWKDNVAAPTMVGQAEPVVATVSSHKAGMLSQLNVGRFQKVKAGDVIGLVMVTEPDILKSSIAVVQSEIEMLRISLSPIAKQQREAINYSQLRLDWMRQRALLANARANLEAARLEFRRTEDLFKDKIISQQVLETAKARQDGLQGEVDELDKLVCEGEKAFQSLQLSNAVDLVKITDDPLRAAIALEESKLRLTEAQLAPIVLKAPMDGIVSLISLRSGEAVMAGQPIVSIATFNPVRIVGYLRPPILDQPKVGMKVEVRTRGLRRELGSAKIVEVGTQLEVVPPALSSPAKLTSADLGLPVDVSLPQHLNIRPGELVDLVLVKD